MESDLNFMEGSCKKEWTRQTLRKMCATYSAWHCPCKQMVDNMKYSFLLIKYMKHMFLNGACALFWGCRHQNLSATLP
ncbi:MAG: hypothetical protein ACD_23C01253G0001 [uncultured bacterium]|nr:MAG: hypothetical protein ACD_23C01253G0001 [uncultured bacterium]